MHARLRANSSLHQARYGEFLTSSLKIMNSAMARISSPSRRAGYSRSLIYGLQRVPRSPSSSALNQQFLIRIASGFDRTKYVSRTRSRRDSARVLPCKQSSVLWKQGSAGERFYFLMPAGAHCCCADDASFRTLRFRGPWLASAGSVPHRGTLLLKLRPASCFWLLKNATSSH